MLLNAVRVVCSECESLKFLVTHKNQQILSFLEAFYATAHVAPYA